jgi:hypothetical protein
MRGKEREVEGIKGEKWIMDLDHVLTDKDYEIAKRNGIRRAVVHTRFNRLFWDKEDCISKPVQSYNDHDGWRKECKRLGKVHLATFDQRIKRGWKPEEAATLVLTEEERIERIRQAKRKYPAWVYAELGKNGVPRQTFLNRMNSSTADWTMEEACTAPKGVRLADWRLRDYKSS